MESLRLIPCFNPNPANSTYFTASKPHLRVIPATPVLEIDTHQPNQSSCNSLLQTCTISSYLEKPPVPVASGSAMTKNSRNNSFVSVSDTVSAVSGQVMNRSQYNSSSLLSGSVKGRHKVFRTQSERVLSPDRSPQVRQTSIKMLKRKKLMKQSSADEYSSTITPSNSSPTKATRKSSIRQVIDVIKKIPRRLSIAPNPMLEQTTISTQNEFLEHFDKVSDTGIVENWLLSIDNEATVDPEESEKLLKAEDEQTSTCEQEIISLVHADVFEDQESLTEAKELKTLAVATEEKICVLVDNQDNTEISVDNVSISNVPDVSLMNSDDLVNDGQNDDNSVEEAYQDLSVQENKPPCFQRERTKSLDSPIQFPPFVRQRLASTMSNESTKESSDTHEECAVTALNTIQNADTQFTSEGDELRKKSTIFRPINYETSRSTSWNSSTEGIEFDKLQDLNNSCAMEGTCVIKICISLFELSDVFLVIKYDYAVLVIKYYIVLTNIQTFRD